jgi:Uma2 family endonuclease
VVVQPKLYTVDEFEQFLTLPQNRDRLFELINGEIAEKVPTREHGRIAANITIDIGNFLDENPIGQIAVEARHRPTDDRYNDRIPDVSIVLGDKPVARRGAENFIPDFCIEIQSPDDSPKTMSEKAAFYLANGARLVWLIYPRQRIVEVLTAADRQLLAENDTLEGGDVLPGLFVPVRDVFRRV